MNSRERIPHPRSLRLPAHRFHEADVFAAALAVFLPLLYESRHIYEPQGAAPRAGASHRRLAYLVDQLASIHAYTPLIKKNVAPGKPHHLISGLLMYILGHILLELPPRFVME